MRRSTGLGSPAAIILKVIFLGLLALGFMPRHVGAAEDGARSPNQSPTFSAPEVAKAPLTTETKPEVSYNPKRADFGREPKSRDAREVADWVVDSGDNQGMPFAILDKVDAKVFVFYPDGRLRGAAPALLGLAKGDDDIPGIGDRKLSEIRPKDRVTPAGRFVASLGKNFNGTRILWVDYNGSVALHPVVTSNPKERRLQRLESPTPLDNRISFGCINVPTAFFFDVVSRAFAGTYGIVYVLPEMRSKIEIFHSYYDVDLRRGMDKSGDLGEKTRVGRHKPSELKP